MTEQPRTSGAVFLSYASEDADAAARICEDLRAAGVEVWFDRSELRGGDAWDSQIKKQIHDCALFVPLISAHTNARIEGYFRGEWNLATRRLVNRAHDAAFLMPVVVDETREADARVPEEFFRAQWTWLPGGETPPAFANRVRHLLGMDRTSAPTAKAAATGVVEPSAGKARSVRGWFWFAGGHGKHRVRSVGLALVALVLVLAGGAFWYYQGANAPTSMSVPAAAPPVVNAAANEKSIAVLPFVNMSSDPEQEYFSDGISEELLNLLAKVPELRVISRSSAFSFKGKDVEISEIAKRLNVAHVLEGSVRKQGNRVRITAQLIDTRSDTHMWSETYDRELTDIFATQDEIALAVVGQLKLALLGDQLPARSTTTSPEAYNLYLRGRHLSDQGTEESLAKAVEFYDKALGVDPRFAEAWAELAYVQAFLANQGFKEVTAGFKEARVSAQKALDLSPDLATAHLALGLIQYFYDWDWMGADASFKKAIAIDPSDAETLAVAGMLAQALGKPDIGIDLCRQAVAHDPVAAVPRVTLAMSYAFTGQLDEAENEARVVLELSPEYAAGWYLLGTIVLQKGQAAPALKMMLNEPVEFWRLTGSSLAYFAVGQKETSDAVLKELIEKYAGVSAYQIAVVYAFRGEKEKAFDWLDRAYRQHDTGLTTLNVDPLMANIKSDPRFSAMLRKLKLPAL